MDHPHIRPDSTPPACAFCGAVMLRDTRNDARFCSTCGKSEKRPESPAPITARQMSRSK